MLTWSKLILMLPTLVAPTGTMPKNPYFHLPSSATRSFSTNTSDSLFTIHGETEKRSPTPDPDFRMRPHVLLNALLTYEVPSLLHHPCCRAVKAVVIARRKVNNSEEQRMSRFDAPRRSSLRTF